MNRLFKIHSAVRLINPDDSNQLSSLRDQIAIADAHGQALSDKCYEPDLTRLPLYANSDYADATFIHWAQQQVAEAYPGARLRYGVIDMVLEPSTNPDGEAVVLPAALVTILEYKGKKILGPLLAGLPGDMLTSKGKGYEPGKQNLAAPYSQIYDAQTQGQLLADMIEHFLDMGKAHNHGKARYDAVVVATPDIGTNELHKRGSYRAFHGLNPADGNALEPPRERMQPHSFSSSKFNYYVFSEDAALKQRLGEGEENRMLDYVRNLRQRYAHTHGLERPAKRLEPRHAADFLSQILERTQGLKDEEKSPLR